MSLSYDYGKDWSTSSQHVAVPGVCFDCGGKGVKKPSTISSIVWLIISPHSGYTDCLCEACMQSRLSFVGLTPDV
jgi:hypothetical protein